MDWLLLVAGATALLMLLLLASHMGRKDGARPGAREGWPDQSRESAWAVPAQRPEVTAVPEAPPSAAAPEAPAPPPPEEELLPADEAALEEIWDDAPEEGDLVAAPPPLGVDELIEELRSGVPSRCREAIDGLVAHGPAALPALEALLRDADPDLKIDAQRAIDQIRG